MRPKSCPTDSTTGYFYTVHLYIQGGLTLHALAAFYRSLKVELMMKKDEHPIHGRVEWREISGLTATSHGQVSSETIRESGRYFGGRTQ